MEGILVAVCSLHHALHLHDHVDMTLQECGTCSLQHILDLRMHVWMSLCEYGFCYFAPRIMTCPLHTDMTMSE